MSAAANLPLIDAHIQQNILTILQSIAALGVDVFAEVLIEFCIATGVGF
jgi:hypothetical protein